MNETEWFADAFERYLPPTQMEHLEQVNENKDLENNPTGTQGEFVPVGKTEKPNENGQCSDVPVGSGDTGLNGDGGLRERVFEGSEVGEV